MQTAGPHRRSNSWTISPTTSVRRNGTLSLARSTPSLHELQRRRPYVTAHQKNHANGYHSPLPTLPLLLPLVPLTTIEFSENPYTQCPFTDLYSSRSHIRHNHRTLTHTRYNHGTLTRTRRSHGTLTRTHHSHGTLARFTLITEHSLVLPLSQNSRSLRPSRSRPPSRSYHVTVITLNPTYLELFLCFCGLGLQLM